jgi:hypothetical protein
LFHRTPEVTGNAVGNALKNVVIEEEKDGADTAMLALQVNPAPDVQFNALLVVEQLGMANAVGEAVDAVTFASTVLAACVAMSVVVTRPVAVNAPVTVGLAMVGDVARTLPPDPVTAAPRDAATPVPKPVRPTTGRPIAFVSVADEGVPRAGLTSVGEFDSTTDPVPVVLELPVPPLEGANGVCRVMLLNVGDGKVWAIAIAGTNSAVRITLFMCF